MDKQQQQRFYGEASHSHLPPLSSTQFTQQSPLYQLQRQMSDSYTQDRQQQHLNYPPYNVLPPVQTFNQMFTGNSQNFNQSKNQMYGPMSVNPNMTRYPGFNNQQELYPNGMTAFQKGLSLNKNNFDNTDLSMYSAQNNQTMMGQIPMSNFPQRNIPQENSYLNMLSTSVSPVQLNNVTPQALYSKSLMQRLTQSGNSTYDYHADQNFHNGNNRVDEPLIDNKGKRNFLMQQLRKKAEQPKAVVVSNQSALEKVHADLPADPSEPPFLGSAEDLDMMAKNLMDEVDGLTFDSFQEFLGSPLLTLGQGLMHSPMSVESNKTDSSSGSLKDLRNLRSLSLVVSPTSADANVTFSTSVTPSDVVVSPTCDKSEKKSQKYTVKRTIKKEQSLEECQKTIHKSSIIPKNKDFSKPLKEIVPQNVSPFENDKDDVFKRDNLNTANFMSLKAIHNPYPDGKPPSFIHRSMSTPGLDMGTNNTRRTRRTIRKSDSDGLLKMARVNPLKVNRKMSGHENFTPRSAFSAPSVDGDIQSDKTIDFSSDIKYEADPTQAIKGLYFENKSFYKIRKNLRELASLRSETARSFPPGNFSQKCSKLFLNQLMSMKPDKWVLKSVEPDVKNDKDINLKSFTERKIKIYDNISQEYISEYIEPSDAQPFTYLSDDLNKKQQPSEKLMNLLTDKKMLSPVQKDSCSIKVL